MKVEVRGSRWVEDDIYAQQRSPHYVVRFKAQNYLSQIDLGSAHEEGGWKEGWDENNNPLTVTTNRTVTSSRQKSLRTLVSAHSASTARTKNVAFGKC